MHEFSPSNPANLTKNIRERDKRHVWHPWSPLTKDSARLTFRTGKGCRVVDIEGKEYIDCASLNLTCGYGNETIAKAIYNQAIQFHGTDLSLATHEPVGLLAERLAHLLPDPFEKTLFVNSGSEGIDASLFIAASYWQHLNTSKLRVVSFANGYHGSTLFSRSLCNLSRVVQPFGNPLPVTYIDLPEDPKKIKYPESLKNLLNLFENALLNEENGAPMAVLVEPFLNVGGGICLPKGFLYELRKLCDKYDALLIIDEVFTGYGRTGKMFAFQHEKIVPDIFVSSKGLAGGYMPITAVSVQSKIYDTFNKEPLIGGLRFGHTTSGHAIACAAALATLDILEKENLLERAQNYGHLLLKKFESYEGIGEILDVRGFGLILVIEMATLDSATKMRELTEMNGLLVRQNGQSIMVVPPLVINDAEINNIIQILEESIKTGGFS